MGGEGREGNFQMFEILTASVLCSANMRHHSKFCADRSNRCGYMAVFQFFILDLSKLADIEGALNLAPSRNWYLTVISNSGPEMVLVEQYEQSRCFRRLSPLTSTHRSSVITLALPPTSSSLKSKNN